MHLRFSLTLCLSLAIAAIVNCGKVAAQESPLPSNIRNLAPGVLNVIPPVLQEGDASTGPDKLLDIKATEFQPNLVPKTDTIYERAKTVVFRREIHQLEFAFKPLRMVEADIPQTDGVMQRKVIWYMIYRVRNTGEKIVPTPKDPVPVNAEDKRFTRFEPQLIDAATSDPQSVRFYPHFVLEGWAHNPIAKNYTKKDYLDRVIPSAIPQILDNEVIPPAKPMLLDSQGKPVMDENGKPVILLNSVQMAQVSIPPSDENNDNSVWGVVTWEDIDPRMDFLSVYVRGLTNAFKLDFDQDGKPTYRFKTLKLNFWRPGDSVAEEKDTIHYGVPLMPDPVEQLKILRLYDLPGPTLAAYELIATSDVDGKPFDRKKLAFRIDAQANAKYEVPVLQALIDSDRQPFPQEIRDAFAAVGVDVPASEKPTVIVPKGAWQINGNEGGTAKRYLIRYEPQLWDAVGNSFKILDQIDYAWIYR